MELIISSGSVSYNVKDYWQSRSVDIARASMALLWCCISQSLQATAGDYRGLCLVNLMCVQCIAAHFCQMGSILQSVQLLESIHAKAGCYVDTTMLNHTC